MKFAVRQFGGLRPSVQPRNLDADNAQLAANLDMRFGDFRPLRSPGASVTAVATGTKAVFRTPGGTWLSSTTDTDYVQGQLHDVEVDTVYMTGRSAYPEVWRQGTGYRRLGVPAPTAAPTVTVDTTNEFSSDELATARATLPAQLTEMLNAALVATPLGVTTAGPPTTGTTGWLAHGSVGALPTVSALQAAFCVPMVASGSDWVMTDPDAHNFLLAPELGGKRITYSGNQFWAVPVYVYGTSFAVDSAGLTAALKTVMDPSDTAVRLWTDPEVDGLVDAVEARFDPAVAPYAELINGIKSAFVDLGRVYDSAVALVEIKAAMTAFFARTEVASQISNVRGDPSMGDSSARLSGLYAQEVAGRCYGLGHFDSTMAESDVTPTAYFSDVYTTSVAANIRADFDAALTTDRRGVKIYDRVSLGKKLRDRMDEINNQRTANRWPQSNIDANVEICLGILDRVFTDANWAKNPAWPYNAGVDQKTAGPAAAARTRLKAATDLLTAAYQDAATNLRNYVSAKMFDVDVLAKLPTPVDRILESRTYVYTHVTDFGEESAPSPASAIIDCDQNDIVTVSAPAPPVGRFVRRMRLYRSNTGVAGAAFQFVVENVADVDDTGWLDPASRTLVDNFRPEALQEPCPTLSWAEPPADLAGLAGMPNGIQLGFVGSRLYACEPFTPYAFPVEYQQTTEFPIVGIGVVGQTAVVLTEGNPYLASGADSASLSLQKLESNQACVSKRSIAGGEGGVFYASPDGVCLATPSGVTVLTMGAYSRADWLALQPAQSFGRFHEGVYYLCLTGTSTCVSIDLVSRRISTMQLAATALHADLLTDTLYAAVGTTLIPLFAGTRATGTWRSKKIPVAGAPAFTCARVESEFEASVVLRVYGDGVLVHTATFSTLRMQRLPTGHYRDVEFEVESSAVITGLLVASSPAELGPA